ncbi:hypothetical protein CBF23_010960 [Marinomonas agarivorans]|nr:hypothetical protein CBF23_010960 [Marinomonas agarivorans]
MYVQVERSKVDKNQLGKKTQFIKNKTTYTTQKNQPVFQKMKYATAIHTTYTPQSTPMSCWAACIAAVTGIPQQSIIEKYKDKAYEVNGLPDSQDWSVMVEDFGLMKVTPWKDAVTPYSMVAMIGLPEHWVVSYGLKTDDKTGNITHILIWDPWYGKTYEVDMATFEKDWKPSVAYKKV